MHKYWFGFVGVIVASFCVLGWTGVRIDQAAPPIPERVIAESGRIVVQPGEIKLGQNVWQSLGGMEMGSI